MGEGAARGLLALVLLGCGAKTGLAVDPPAPPEPVEPCPVKRWSSCRFLDEAVVFVSGAQNAVSRPLVAWTGASVMVMDGDGGSPALRGFSFAGDQVFERSLGGFLPQSIAWHPSAGVGVLVGRAGVVWIDSYGDVVGQRGPLEMTSQDAFAEVSPTSDGFLMTLTAGPGRVDLPGAPIRFARVGFAPEDISWSAVDDGQRRRYGPRHGVDGDGLLSWVAPGDAPLDELYRVDEHGEVSPVYWYDGTPCPESLFPVLRTGLAEHDGRVFSALWMQRTGHVVPLVWLLEVSPSGPSLWWPIGEDYVEDEATLLSLGDDLIVVTAAGTRAQELSLSAFDSTGPVLRDSVVVGRPDRMSSYPRVVPTARGFALVWHDTTVYDPDEPMELANLLQIADCCVQ